MSRPLTEEQLDELEELWLGKIAVAEIRRLRELLWRSISWLPNVGRVGGLRAEISDALKGADDHGE